MVVKTPCGSGVGSHSKCFNDCGSYGLVGACFLGPRWSAYIPTSYGYICSMVLIREHWLLFA